MLKEVSQAEWMATVAGSANYSIFVNPEFLAPIAFAYNYSLKYYLYNLNEKPVVGFACFCRGNRIKVPTHQIYSGIWWDIKFNTIKYREVLIQAISLLKKKYSTIHFRLPPTFNDIRPFQWEGFSYKINYTYTRDTTALNFEYNIRSRVRKAAGAGITCGQGQSFDEVWDFQYTDLKRFRRTDSYINQLGGLLKECHERRFLAVYEARLGDKMMGCACILIDRTTQKAYNLLIGSANSNYQTGVQAMLYDFIFNDLQKQDIKEFDLYGADIKGVADFKASLGASLQPHYTVTYQKRKNQLAMFKEWIKDKLRKLRSRYF